jgi:hypothetical protein
MHSCFFTSRTPSSSSWYFSTPDFAEEVLLFCGLDAWISRLGE